MGSDQVVVSGEDVFVFPPAWYRYRVARRGSAGAVRFEPDATAHAAFDAQLVERGNVIARFLASRTTQPATRAAAEAWLTGAAGATPLGAAAAVVAAQAADWRNRERLVAAADRWVAEHGVAFAAEAAATLMALRIADDFAPPGPRGAGPDASGVRLMRAGETQQAWRVDMPMQLLLRVRQAVATASDDDYARVVAALTPYRAAHVYARMATSVLAPTEREWVEQDIASAVADRDGYRAALLLTAVSTGEQSAALFPIANAYTVMTSLALLTTLADGLGPAAAPALFHWLDEHDLDAESRRRLLSVLAVLPGDEVLGGLVDRLDERYVAPALLEAAERYPVRALRLLAEAGARRTAADLLRGHLLSHPELELPPLSPEAAARVRQILDEAAAVTTAPAEAVPPLLADPPWRRSVKRVKPVVITGLTCTDPATVSWLPGEREEWRETFLHRYGEKKLDWVNWGNQLLQGSRGWHTAGSFFVDAPEKIALSVLARWQPRETYNASHWMRPVLARFPVAAVPALVQIARRAPAEAGDLLLPFASPEIAVIVADWLTRLKSARKPALAWLLRHPAEAARALVPAALQKAGAARRQAEQTLLTLHANGHTAAVREAAAGYGEQAAAAIGTLLSTDPLAVLPPKMPATPGWAVPGLLPPVRLRDGSGALPADAVTNLITMLAISKLDEPYAGLAIVREACDPASLAEFGWGVFQRWQTSGAESKENWALAALGLIGDDETVRRLSPLILAWPGEGGHAKAVTGVNILATIGTDVALMHLHGISQRAKFKGLKTAANDKMAEVAAGLGLSADQLADRLVPDFGLQADGSLRLDYGTRQFTVGFDEQLRPYVADAAGKRLKALPKPGARDDAELAPAAYKQFSGLKKDVRTVATDQVRRLERAMVVGRRWTGAEFRQLFVGHPLLWHIVRRLVWGHYDADGRPIGAIRVAEDRTFSTVDDEETTLADDATVGVAHPLHLGDTLAGWAEVFADYQILQPFPQLSRPTFRLTPEEEASRRLTRFEGLTVPTTKLIGLERRGWRRETPQDAGMQGRMELSVGDRQEIAVEIEPGIAIGMIDEFPEQKIEQIYLHDGTGHRWRSDASAQLPLSRLDPVAASELIRDLTEVTA